MVEEMDFEDASFYGESHHSVIAYGVISEGQTT